MSSPSGGWANFDAIQARGTTSVPICQSNTIKSDSVNPARGLGERCKLPQRGPGQSLGPPEQFWHIWSPGKASGSKDLGSSCALIFFPKLALMAVSK